MPAFNPLRATFNLVRSAPWRLLVVVMVLGGLSFMALGHREPPPPKIKLAVLVVFDQMRGDYLQRWQPYFGPAGFQRIMKDGTWFDNCHYPYAITKTAAGHASFLTGCSPDHHGIIDNDWYDRGLGKTVYCVQSERYQRVPPKPKTKGASPDNLLAQSVGDVLKRQTKGKGRVVGLSIKDRSAILPAGKQPDACYWFDSSTGEFVTSTYYRDAPHAWVTKFNRSHYVEGWRGVDWKPLLPNLDLAKLKLYPDPDAEEGDFNYTLPGEKDPKYYARLAASPYGNELLLELAKRAIEEEKLGQDEVPDLLSVSFSSNDLVGHAFGPDSPEVMDVTIRSDRLMANLLEYLDRTIGPGQYVLAVCADHGVCPLPEVSRQQGKEARRIPLKDLTDRAGAYLDRQYGNERPAKWFASTDESWLYLNRALLRQRGLEAEKVATELARWLVQQPGIQSAYSRQQLEDPTTIDDPVARAVRRSYYPPRAGDIVLIQKPLYLFSSTFLGGTTHGTPYPYDTHVPLLVFGPGVPRGVSAERVAPQQIAPIFAHFLGIPKPRSCETSLPARLH